MAHIQDLPSKEDFIQLASDIASLSLERSIREYASIRAEMDRDIIMLRKHVSQTSHRDSRLTLSLANLILERCLLFTDEDLLDQSILLYRGLVSSASNYSRENTAEFADYLDGLGEALAARYEQSSNYDDIDEAVSLHAQSLQLRISLGIDQSDSLRGQGVALSLCQRYENYPDYSTAYDYLNRAVSCTAPAALCRRPRSLAYLGSVLGQMNDKQRVGTALTACRDALALAPPGHPDHPLASVLAARLLSYIVRVTDEVSPAYERAVLYAYELTAAIKHYSQYLALGSLSAVIGRLCIKSGVYVEMFSTTDRLRRALERCSHLHSRWGYLGVRTTQMHLLGFHLTSEQHFLDNAIVSGRLVQSGPELMNSRDKKSWTIILYNLSVALHTRFGLTGREVDLDEAQQYIDHLVTSELHEIGLKPSLMHTAAMLHMNRFQLSEDLSELDKAASYFSICIPMLPQIDIGMAVACVTGFTETSHARYNVQKDPGILYETVDILRLTLRRDPPKIWRHKLLHCLSGCLCLIAEYLANPTLAIEAISLEEEAIALLPSGNEHLAEYLGELGISYLVLWRTGGDMAHHEIAVKYFLDSQDRYGTSLYTQYLHCIEWYETALRLNDPELVSLSQQQVLSLLPHVILFGKNLRVRLRLIKLAPAFARDAALRMLSQSDSDAHAALETLEQGRGVFWSRALSSRAPLDGLPGALAKQLKDVYALLENDTLDQVDGLSRRKALTVEFTELLHRVKQIPGYEYLQGSRPFNQLMTSARKGNIVVLIPGDNSSVALVVDIRSPGKKIPLPSVTLEMLQKVLGGLEAEKQWQRGHLSSDVESTRDTTGRKMTMVKRWHPGRDKYQDILGQIWTKIVRPIIIALGLQMPNDLSSRPRIWWCPTGPFSFIPLHAAGIYGGTDASCVSDYVVSSYTPTLSTLINAYRDLPTISPSSPNMNTFLVGVSNAEGYDPLPNAVNEINGVQKIFPHATVLSDAGPDSVTNAQVLEKMSSSTIVHLACHGRQFQDDPLRSGFVLPDSILDVSALMEITVPNGAFAFLSACESATGDKKLSDEAVHLAATMMFVGFRSVVGTMWSMNDTDGPTVAEHVYRELLSKSTTEFNYDAIPRALDAITRRLRADGVHPSRWATWIHMGI